MAALGNVAPVYASFEEAGEKLEDESEKGETLDVDVNTALEELAKAPQQMDRQQDELRGFHENLDNANVEVNICRDKLNTAVNSLHAVTDLNNCQSLLDSACRGLEDVDR